jgi:outer membrane biosynthesis protein TonB
MKFALLFRLALLFALTAILVSASPQKQVPDCCTASTEKLSPQQVKSMVRKTEPIQPPCCADQLRLNGTAVLAVAVDDKGKVTCVQSITGHPLIIGAVIESVSRWRFQPYVVRGRSRSFCGRVALRFQGNERLVKFDVVEAPPD